MQRIRAALFDFGGVFTDSPFAALHDLGAELGAPAERLMELVFGPYHEDSDHPWHRLERGEVSLLEAREGILALGRDAHLEADPFRLFALMSGRSGARDALVDRVRALRGRGIRTALVTNNVREFREHWMAMLPLPELFDAVVDSSEVGVRKPDPAIFRIALERVGGLAPEQAIFLDDYRANVAAAEALGIRGVLVEEDPAEALATLDALIEAHASAG